MGDLVDLKRTPSEKKDDSMLASDMSSEDYAWGLQIELGNDELEKLGIDKLNVGDEFEITALVRVKSFSENSQDGGGNRLNAGLLIKAIAMPDKETKSAADKLYPSGNK